MKMASSTAAISSISPIPVSSLPMAGPKTVNLGATSPKLGEFIRMRRVTASRMPRFSRLASFSLSGDGSASVEKTDVPFPNDYTELLEQARGAVELAMKNNKQLMEIEFPTAGLQSVPGDGEGGIEMTESMQLIREFCDRFIRPEKASRTRIFFPEASEVEFARQSVFAGASFKLDYLTKPSFFQDFGVFEKVKMVDRVKPEDEVFLVAYPYFNVNDYPPFFYPKLAALNKTLLPVMETVYYIHNFKGRNGGRLFRCYPGPWKVLRSVGNKVICVHEQDNMPSLKEVALEILPSA